MELRTCYSATPNGEFPLVNAFPVQGEENEVHKIEGNKRLPET